MLSVRTFVSSAVNDVRTFLKCIDNILIFPNTETRRASPFQNDMAHVFKQSFDDSAASLHPAPPPTPVILPSDRYCQSYIPPLEL